MADLVQELRASAIPGTHVGDCMLRAADEIERLRATIRLAYDEQTERGGTYTAQVLAPEIDMMCADTKEPEQWAIRLSN